MPFPASPLTAANTVTDILAVLNRVTSYLNAGSATGPTGATGATGPMGPMGPQGPPGPSANTAPPPANTVYTSHPELTVYARPPLPALGVAGTSYVDPVFGAKILRVTDGNTRPGANASFRTPSNQNSNGWSVDGLHFWTTCNDGTISLFDFNPITGVATYRPTQLPFNAEPTFSRSSANLIYGAGISYDDHVTIGQYNIATGVNSILIDLATASTPAPINTYTNAIDNQNGTLICLYGGASQDAHYLILVWNLATGTYTVKNILTHPGGGFHLHSCALDKTGRYILLSPANADVQAKLATSQVYWLDLQTDVISELTVAPGGHTCFGYDGLFINNDVASGTWDAAQWVIRSLVTNPNAPTNLVTPTLAPPRDVNVTHFGEYTCWNAARAGMPVPVVIATELYGIVSPWRTFDCEIFALAPDGSGACNRFLHHRSDVSTDTNANGYQFEYTVRQNVSPDGKWVYYTSNYDKTLGMDSTGIHRQDVFLAKLT